MVPLPLSLPSLWVPPLSPRSLPRSRVSCCSPQVPGAPDHVSDDEDPVPCLLVTSPPLGLHPVLLLPHLLTVPMTFPFRVSPTALPWFRVLVMLRFLLCTKAFLALAPPLPLLLFAVNLPFMLAAAADALSGVLNTDLHLLMGMCKESKRLLTLRDLVVLVAMFGFVSVKRVMEKWNR
jgi:hypothetical protein